MRLSEARLRYSSKVSAMIFHITEIVSTVIKDALDVLYQPSLDRHLPMLLESPAIFNSNCPRLHDFLCRGARVRWLLEISQLRLSYSKSLAVKRDSQAQLINRGCAHLVLFSSVIYLQA
jgi:hypothetical protein